MTRLAIFDCDGTLADGQANICRAMEVAFVRAGLAPPARAATRRIVGLSLPEAMRVLAPDADHHALADSYRQVFRAMRDDGSLDEEPLFDGIAEAIGRLSAAGWTLGIATGKSDRGLAHLLASHGLTGRFATLQTADRHPSKPHPAMLHAALAETGARVQDAAMIGDTSFDMAMAHAAGMRAVGVGWGYHPAAELVAAGADAVAETPRALPALLDTLVPA